MTDNANTNQIDPYQKRKNKEELKKHLVSFAMMIVFTVIAFVIVASESMDKMFVIPLIIIMAVVQVAFQFYYFMHLREKGHEMPALMIYGGVWCALLTLAALSVITWW
jgi:cytochrome c oxidase subunit 4